MLHNYHLYLHVISHNLDEPHVQLKLDEPKKLLSQKYPMVSKLYVSKLSSIVMHVHIIVIVLLENCNSYIDLVLDIPFYVGSRGSIKVASQIWVRNNCIK